MGSVDLDRTDNNGTNAARAVATIPNDQLLKAAIYYASRGILVFPCKPDKKPHTRRGFKDATTDANKVSTWWKRWPDANIGIPTGKVSGLLVLDVDLSFSGKDDR